METGAYWRYGLPHEVQEGVSKCKKDGEGDFASINSLELMEMAMAV